FPEIALPRAILRLIAQISIALEVDGHRSDLVCARAAQAKAAYDRADTVALSHVTDVAQMVFSHRLRAVPFGKAGPNLGGGISRTVGQVGWGRGGQAPPSEPPGSLRGPPPVAAVDGADDQQQEGGADECLDEQREQPRAQVDVEEAEEPAAQE